MADVAPLTPLRYDLGRLASGLSSVVAPPYDVIDQERRAELARDPHNIVHVDLPLGEGDAKYKNSAARMGDWIARGVLVRDNEPAFYRFDQTYPSNVEGGRARTRRGFLALVRAVPFSDEVVLPHERTHSAPKEDRLKLLRATGAALSPGLMLFRDPGGALDPALETGRLIAEFATEDGGFHSIAKVTAKDALRAIVAGLAQSQLLIADGHHRYETAVRYADEVSAQHPSASPRAEHRYTMALLVNGDDPNLLVFPTHRHVHSLMSFDFDAMIKKAAGSIFDIREMSDHAPASEISNELGLATGPTFAAASSTGRVVMLALKKDADLASHPTLGNQPVALRKTDVAILHHGIFEHVLDMTIEAQAAKTNLWYAQDAATALAELRAGKGQALFLMNATPVAQVREIAESGEVMPQKSTFFYPKVLTGVTIHTLDPTRVVSDSCQ